MTTDAFLTKLQRFDDVSYQQTPFWAEARRADWPEYEMVGWYTDAADPISVAIIRYRRVPGTHLRFAFIPYGPIVDWDTADIAEQLAVLRDHLEAKNVIGVRMFPYLSLRRWKNQTVRAGLIDPAATRFCDLAPDDTYPTALRLQAILRDTGWIRRSVPEAMRIDHALYSYRLDLENRTEEDVLSGMHRTWRYNAKKGEREGIDVTLAATSDVNEFHRILAATGARNDFATNSPEFLRTMWTHLGEGMPGRFTTHFARLNGELLSASTTARVSSTAECIFTATNTHRPKAKPSNTMYLEIIRQLIAEGAKSYDLGAVKDCISLDNRASGLARFKAEMGADVHEYMGEWELPIAPRAFAIFTLAIPAYSAVRSRANGLISSASRIRSRVPASSTH